jgi:MoxR-like ATPase
VDYPRRERECEMVRVHGHQTVMPDLAQLGVTPVADLDAIVAARGVVAALRLSDELVEYIVDLIGATRNHPALQFGASPRSANMLAIASRAVAALEGREFVIPDDVKELFLPVMRHRVVLSPGAEVEGQSTDEVLGQIVGEVAAPR